MTGCAAGPAAGTGRAGGPAVVIGRVAGKAAATGRPPPVADGTPRRFALAAALALAIVSLISACLMATTDLTAAPAAYPETHA